MTQNGVSAFARLARWFAVSAVLLLVSAGALAAQQTGKIEGRVRDQAGAPIANAQVTIVGTAFSALTNPQGYYFINNVPAGTVALRASFIGYKRTEVTGVRVLAAQTITQDIQIEASPVVIEELTVVAAENPLVPRDEVTTKQRVDGQTTQELPVDRINNVLLLQPGVVASAGGGTLSIRGGRDDEAATYVDGVPVQSGQRGGGFVGQGGQGVSGNANTVGTNQFEQISVTTGAASADQGNAQSGIINLSTITGGQKFAGRLAMESDEMFPNTTSLGFNRVEGNLSGPLGLKGLSFALGAALEGQRFGYTDTYTGNPGIGKGRENYPLFVDAGEDTDVGPLPVAFDEDGEPTEFATPRKFSVFTGNCSDFENSANSGIADNYGEDCNGARTPLNSGSGYQLSGNINWSYGNGSRLRFTALASQNQGRNFSNGLQLNVLGAMNGTRVENQVFTVNWTQNLTRSTERALALDAAFSYQRDRGINSQVEGGGPGTGTLGFYISDIPLKYGLDFLDERGERPAPEPARLLRAGAVVLRPDRPERSAGAAGHAVQDRHPPEPLRPAEQHLPLRRRPDGPHGPGEGRPLHRSRRAGLAGGPLQPPAHRRPVHPVRHHQLLDEHPEPDLLGLLHGQAQAVERVHRGSSRPRRRGRAGRPAF
jgi:outer membrane receptor protein involved in Fe transport